MPFRSGAYIGPDRRRTAVVPVPWRAYALAGLLLAAGALAVAAAAARTDLDPHGALRLHAVLDGAAAALAVAGGAACLVLFQLLKEPAVLRVGLAVGTVGAVNLVATRVVGPVAGLAGFPGELEAAARAAGFAVAGWLFARALVSPDIEASLRLGPAVRAVVLTVAGLTAAVAVTGTGGTLAQSATGTHAPVLVPGVAGPAVFGALAVGHAVNLVRNRRWVSGWAALFLAVGAAADAATGRAAKDGDLWALANSTGWAAASLVLLGGVLQRLYATVTAQRRVLYEVQADAEAGRVLNAQPGPTDRTWLHDLRNSLAAVEGAVTTLVRRHERLGPGDRDRLRELAADGVQQLKDVALAPGNRVVPLPEAVTPVVEELRRAGAHVDVRVDGVAVAGDRGVVTALIGRVAAALAGGGDVRWSLSAEPGDGVVELRIAAKGPTARTVDAMGLQLKVAARLAKQQGGDIGVDGAGDELAVLIRLPSAPQP